MVEPMLAHVTAFLVAHWDPYVARTPTGSFLLVARRRRRRRTSDWSQATCRLEEPAA